MWLQGCVREPLKSQRREPIRAGGFNSVFTLVKKEIYFI